MTLRTIKTVIAIQRSRPKKRRFFGRGEWYCVACGSIWTSLEMCSLSIKPKRGCPNCGGKLKYEEV